ncbi:MAG TPA: FHA domain-containing protein [Verrucomicrobiae bacterium]|jgi:predicted component of type VI protein secretion system|nr:FHA domain-containing protein [Verrucomicrobiae bacterium]
MPKLVVNPGTSLAREFDLKPGVYRVGRAVGNDIRIQDASMSGSHAEIMVQGGIIMIKDLGSTNGIFINGSPVKYGELRPGQSLRLGWVDMILVGEPAAKKMVEGIPVPNEIAAEALEAARRRRMGQKPGP